MPSLHCTCKFYTESRHNVITFQNVIVNKKEFLGCKFSNLSNWKIYCDDPISLSQTVLLMTLKKIDV